MEKQQGRADGSDVQKQQAMNVARTNDESVVSKRSAARAGYVDDPYLAHFVRKPSRRAALINRGYYIRREAVALAVSHFLALHKGRCQTVSLGAGFDTLFFVLAARDQHPTRFYEVDFSHVVKNKRTLIEGTPELMSLVGADAVIDQTTHEISSSRYALVCGDLCDFASTRTRLMQQGLSYDMPTLFLAECVFTYMSNGDSDKLIHWAASAPFPECFFVTYEQVRPYDAFGRTMRANLSARGSDLLGIEGYPTAAAQQQRYFTLGFKSVRVRSMLQVYLAHLPPHERACIDSMEEFDEHEEWREKCAHYVVAVSSTLPDRSLPFAEPVSLSAMDDDLKPEVKLDPVAGGKLSWIEKQVNASGRTGELKRWGHSASVVSGDRVIVFGGYGGPARHERLNSVAVLQENVVTLPPVSGVAPSARVLHGACVLEGDKVLVHGGRSGPGTPMNDCFVLDCAAMQWKKLHIEGAPYRYRHSLTSVADGAAALVFGGRRGWKHGEESNEIWIVSPHDMSWRCIPYVNEVKPIARASHAACWHRGALYVHGGFSDVEGVMSDMWRLVFDGGFKSCRAELVCDTFLPRFAHSALSIGEDTVLLVAGQNNTLQNNVIVFDSAVGKVQSVTKTAETWSRTQAVAVGNQVILVGGGMLCFSFGSAFCEDAQTVLTFAKRVAPLIHRAAPAAVEVHAVAIPRAIAQGHRIIQRVHNATPEQFRAIVSRQREPVLFCGANIPRWSREDVLAAVAPNTQASIHVCESPLLDKANKNFRFEVVPFAEMMTRVEDPKEHLYFRSLGSNARKDPSNVSECFPVLANQYLVPEFAKAVVLPETIHSSCLRFSSQDIEMWTHYDINDNLLSGVRGRKRLVLFHPEEIRHLYPEGTASAVLNVDAPDLAWFPRFAKAVKWEGILEEGEVLFIPAMWWHNVRTLTPCYGVNVFFRHLPSASYQANDLYGNKDPVLAVAAEKALKQAIASLSDLPEDYKRFFARKLIMQMKTDLL